MKTSSKWIAAVALAVALVGAWVTASAMSSHKVTQMLQTAVTQGWPDSNFKIRNLQHQAGWFTSHGQLELAYVDKCNPLSGEDTTWMQVSYNMSHLLLPSSLMRFDWTMQPTGDAKASFEKIFQGTVALSGAGHMRLGQSFDTDLNLPALFVSSSDSHFEMAATKGFVSFSGDGLSMDIATDKTNFRGHGQALEIQQVQISVDLDNRKFGTGTSSIHFGKISGSDLTLEGMKFSSKAQQHEGRYNMSLSYNLDKAAYQQYQLTDMAVSYALNGLHSDSVAKLIALSGVSCGFQNMTNEEEQQMRGAVKTLLMQGLSTGLTTVNAKLKDGKIEGKFMLDMSPNESDRLELTQHLKVQGHLQVEGSVLSADQRKAVLDVGFAKASPQGLTASLQYADRALKLNDKDLNSPMVSMMLSELENKLNDWLNNTGKNRANASLESIWPVLSEADMPAAEAPAATSDQ